MNEQQKQALAFVAKVMGRRATFTSSAETSDNVAAAIARDLEKQKQEMGHQRRNRNPRDPTSRYCAADRCIYPPASDRSKFCVRHEHEQNQRALEKVGVAKPPNQAVVCEGCGKAKLPEKECATCAEALADLKESLEIDRSIFDF